MSSSNQHGVFGQILLKRNPGNTPEDFRKSYIERHALIAIPFFLANGVKYYAQVHRPFKWASPEAQSKYSDIDLAHWDAVAELAFKEGFGAESMTNGPEYYQEVILPDERRLFVSEAREHMKVVEPGSVVGERVEFIVEGTMMVEFEEWRKVCEEYGGK